MANVMNAFQYFVLIVENVANVVNVIVKNAIQKNQIMNLMLKRFLLIIVSRGDIREKYYAPATLRPPFGRTRLLC
jgi:hypothetical protein